MLKLTNQGKFYIFSHTDRIQKQLLDSGEWEPIQSIISNEFAFRNQTKLIADFGCHIGTFSIPVAINNPEARVLAIDCQPTTLSMFGFNVMANGVSNITMLPLLLLGPNTEPSFREIPAVHPLHEYDTGLFSVAHEALFDNEQFNYDHLVNVVQCSAKIIIDTYRPGIVKIDLEGSDHLVLDGIVDTARRGGVRAAITSTPNLLNSKEQYRPLIISEQMRPVDIKNLKELGYRIFSYKCLWICYPNAELIHKDFDFPITLIEIQ